MKCGRQLNMQVSTEWRSQQLLLAAGLLQKITNYIWCKDIFIFMQHKEMSLLGARADTSAGISNNWIALLICRFINRVMFKIPKLKWAFLIIYCSLKYLKTIWLDLETQKVNLNSKQWEQYFINDNKSCF